MKTVKMILGSFIFLTLTAFSSFAQEFTLTTTKANIISSRALFDLPGLSGNANAIIVATPLDDTATLNPHPIGAWYYNNKWNIFNTDHSVLIPGLKYKLEVFLKPGANQFLHVATKENLGEGGSYLDHPALNNQPNAQISILQNHGSNINYRLNQLEAKAVYNSSTGKWYITNLNGKPLYPNTAYNIVISFGGAIISNTSIPPQKPSLMPTISTMATPIIPTVTQPTPLVLKPSLLPTANTQTTKSIQLDFDNLNDFVAKGLPASAALPTENLDLAAIMMAQKISKGDEQSLPMLLTALQVAGFSVIDENGKVLLQPADGKGQGLGLYDFEAVGALKLANRGITVSLEKIASVITKEATQIPASQFAELMLQDLRTQADNSDNAYLRFYARLIIELGKSSAQPIDLLTAPASQVNLSMLQATLLTRRLQGDFYTLKTKQIGMNQPPFSQQNSFGFAAWRKDDSPLFRSISQAVSDDLPCNLTGDEALMLDGAAILLTYGNGKVMEKIGAMITSTGGASVFTKLGSGLTGANLALGWLKLVASVTMLRGEITVDNPPLIRTKNAEPGERRLMKARIWSEVGKVQMLNCVRAALNVATGLDFNLPTDGPVADVSIEWHFDEENEISLNKFVVFESPKGADANPQKQVTDDKGISKMYLVGAAKIPAVAYQKKPMKIEKKAKVMVGITLKSAKDFKQNWLDIGGIALGIATGGPLGLLGAIPEIGYRLPYVAARATIPVIDHEPCDGQWVGTVTYTVIKAHQQTTNYPAKIPPNSGGTGYFGGSSSLDSTITLSGTATVNSKDGKKSLTNASADEITTLTTSNSGAGYCNKKTGVKGYSSGGTKTHTASGSAQGISTVYFNLAEDYYQILLKPLNVKTTLQTSDQYFFSGGCPGQKAEPSTSHSSTTEYTSSDITGTANYGDDPNTLSGSETSKDGENVRTITWNLRRCNK